MKGMSLRLLAVVVAVICGFAASRSVQTTPPAIGLNGAITVNHFYPAWGLALGAIAIVLLCAAIFLPSPKKDG